MSGTRRPKKPTGSTGSAKVSSAKTDSAKIRSVKAALSSTSRAKAAAHILTAAKGPRTISHRKIEQAVEKVFQQRSDASA